MSTPIVFISRNRVKAGMLDDFKKQYHSSLAITRTEKPNTLIQAAYFNEETTEVTIIRVFYGADALDQQLQGADVRSKGPYQFIEPTAVELYGQPNPYTLEMLKRVAGSGIEIQIFPEVLGGFIRGLHENTA